jgi:very-short-patch-repair endonuclease
MKRFLDYNKKLSERAREMRKNMTQAEKKLRLEFLKHLQKNPPVFDHPLDKGDNQKSIKIKVYPQRIIDNFIVDFYIPEKKLVIEIDGENHFTDNGKIYDEERTKILE